MQKEEGVGRKREREKGEGASLSPSLPSPFPFYPNPVDAFHTAYQTLAIHTHIYILKLVIIAN